MLKHQPPLDRFAAIDYETIDAIDDMIVKGLLMTLIRQRPGEDMTVEKLASTHKQGRKTLEAAMRTLVEMGFVVKLKIQAASTNRWSTVFTVSDRPIPEDFVKEWVDSIEDARAVRVEPARLDPRKNGDQLPFFPTAAIGPVGGNEEKSQVNDGEGNDFPTGPFPTVGDATLAEAAAKEEKVFTQYGGDEVAETEDSLTASGGNPALPGGERETHRGRPSIEEIAGPGSVVARKTQRQRPAGHPSNCICGQCAPRSVPQQPSGSPLDDMFDSFDWNG